MPLPPSCTSCAKILTPTYCLSFARVASNFYLLGRIHVAETAKMLPVYHAATSSNWFYWTVWQGSSYQSRKRLRSEVRAPTPLEEMMLVAEESRRGSRQAAGEPCLATAAGSLHCQDLGPIVGEWSR
mmetsp:Transcript_36919/g.66908  ORF Transcript_36919/g.66908 Transcript_36919/m.66908 type:complete len:127 (-) Transcript_36919:377-757(-)